MRTILLMMLKNGFMVKVPATDETFREGCGPSEVHAIGEFALLNAEKLGMVFTGHYFSQTASSTKNMVIEIHSADESSKNCWFRAHKTGEPNIFCEGKTASCAVGELVFLLIGHDELKIEIVRHANYSLGRRSEHNF